MPETSKITALKERSIITITGKDRKNLLQPLITANLDHLSSQRAIYGALLSPQGKFLHDFFISEHSDTLYLECERDRKDDLLRRLMMYKLRAEATITDRASDLYVLVSPDTISLPAIITYLDPRHNDMGYRAISNREEHQTLNGFEYLNHRLSLGIGEGSHDLIPEKTPLLEGNFEELNGVDFTKGCYVGQEVTARMKYRGTLKKRLLPLTLLEGHFKEGDDIYSADQKKIGIIRSTTEKNAIALIKFTKIDMSQIFHSKNSNQEQDSDPIENAKFKIWVPDFITLSNE